MMQSDLQEQTFQATNEEGLAPCSVTRDTLDRQPAEYREHLVRIMSIQAYAERLGAVELGQWVGRAPDFRLMRVCARICSDEAKHAHWLYQELHLIGVPERDALAIAEGRAGQKPAQASLAGPRAVADTDNTWDDVPLNNMFLDRAGRHMVGNFARSSYEPWARISRRILKDEALHEGFGLRELRRQVRERRDREALAARVTKWFTLGLNFFGPPRSSRSAQLRAYGLKRLDNEQLRQCYRSECEALLEDLGAGDLVRMSNDAFPYS